jgi:fermentation-respiration switch protein FrsA (DUF1100 family)
MRLQQTPILIIQGGKDEQVTEKDARELKGALQTATLLIIPTMTHMLKDTDADSTVNKQLVDALVRFITHK